MILNILKLIRVHQWIKNTFVFVPLLFSLHLFDESYFFLSLNAFLIFCFASSAVYVLNDIVDVEADREHPVKRNRPIASGNISKNTAVIIFVVLLAVIGFWLQFFNKDFIISVIVFLVLNFLYSFWFKHIVILDVFSIAGGFALRVLAGAFVLTVPISSWLMLTTMFISLFLGVMKRRSELTLNAGGENSKSRKVLAQYSVNFADQMVTVAAAGVIICYALYSVAPRTISIFNTEDLIYTTPFVVFGIFRYMYLEYKSGKGENTTRVLITDIPMIITVLLYLAVTVFIIYKII